MDWNGFTDEELQKINSSDPPTKQRQKSARHVKNPGVKAMSSSPISGDVSPSPIIGNVSPSPIIGAASLANPAKNNNKDKQEEFLTQIKLGEAHVTRTRREDRNIIKSEEDKEQEKDNEEEEKKKDNKEEEKKKKKEEEIDIDENPFKPDSPQPVKGSRSKLEELQRRQGELEEKNKLKEKELNKTISEKFAATAEQARLLSNLKQELASLEHSITNDICILRDRIDESNRECYNARKRYELAEREYVSSKLQLHQANQLKEGLQEHLFTIIQTNETKKSQKLEDLMSKLDKYGISSPTSPTSPTAPTAPTSS